MFSIALHFFHQSANVIAAIKKVVKLYLFCRFILRSKRAEKLLELKYSTVKEQKKEN